MSHKRNNIPWHANTTEFMLRDGSVKGCFITPEKSEKIAKKEGIKLSNPNPDTDTERKDCSSKSYITIYCSENADPKYNRLQLRTDPPIFIELQPGPNTLTVEEYPDLKYGYRQIEHPYLEDDNNYEVNCEGIVRIDLSHFDASAMTSMDYMFQEMRLDEIIFGAMDTSNVTSMVSTFDSLKTKDMDLSCLDLSNVKNTAGMFMHGAINTVSLPKLSSTVHGEGMFHNIHIDKIVFNDAGEYKIESVLNEIFSEDRLHLLFNGVREVDQIESIIKITEELNSVFIDPNSKYITCDFGKNIKFKTSVNSDGDLQCLIAFIQREEKHAMNLYEINGTQLISVDDKEIKIAYVPDGITDICEHAFKGCKELETVVLPESIIRIHHSAFALCKRLERINIPDKVEYIGEKVFDGCKSLKHLYIPNSVSSCLNFGYSHFDFIRIPYDAWTGWTSDTTSVKNLVIGLPRYASNFDIRPLDEFIGKTPYITFEPFEATADGHDIDGLKVIDGMLLGVTNSNLEDSCGNVLGIFSIPKTTLALPFGIEKICACHSEVDYLYIPETVDEIDDEAFDTFGGRYQHFVTKASNLEHLFNTLPISLGTVIINTI